MIAMEFIGFFFYSLSMHTHFTWIFEVKATPVLWDSLGMPGKILYIHTRITQKAMSPIMILSLYLFLFCDAIYFYHLRPFERLQKKEENIPLQLLSKRHLSNEIPTTRAVHTDDPIRQLWIATWWDEFYISIPRHHILPLWNLIINLLN